MRDFSDKFRRMRLSSKSKASLMQYLKKTGVLVAHVADIGASKFDKSTILGT